MRKIVFAVLAISLLSSCTKKAAESSEKELLVGTDAAYAPFEIENPDKTITGFDIDVINAIAAKEHLKLKFVNTPWEGIFSQLSMGDRDLLVSAITITDARKKEVDFSEPYFESMQLIAVPTNSKVANVDDLKGLKVGLQTGTTGDEVVSNIIGKTNPNIKRFESTPVVLKELQGGGVDVVVADNGVVNNFLKNNKATFKTISDPKFPKEYYGMAVKKGNLELLKKLNSGLSAIKADGTYAQIYQKYFDKKVE